MLTFVIRYRLPPHAHGFDIREFQDEFDAQIYAEDTYGAALISCSRRPRDHGEAEAHDGIVRAGPMPDWLRKIGARVGLTEPTR